MHPTICGELFCYECGFVPGAVWLTSYSSLSFVLLEPFRYVETITELFEISGEFVSQEVSQSLMTLIADGAGEDGDEDADTILRQHSVTIYANLLEKPISKLPQLLIETMAWVLGEYAYISADYSLEEILSKLCALVHKGKQLEVSTRKIIVSAVMKLVAQAGTCPPQAAKIIDDFAKSKDEDLQQRCIEFQNLITSAPHMLAEVLPVDASCEDVQVDPNLSFMDLYVRQAVANGAKPYEKPDDDDDDDYTLTSTSKASVFKMTPYAVPIKPGASYSASMGGVGSNTPQMASMGGVGTAPPSGSYSHSQQNGASTNAHVESNEPQLNVRNVANVWGRGGLAASTPAPPPVAPPQANTFSTPAPPPTSNTWSNNNNSSYSTQSATQPPPEPVKTEDQLRKERMAAALFGGSAPSEVPTRPAIARRATPRAPVASSVPAPAPVAPTPPAPPAPEIDLLDFMDAPMPVAAVAPGVDILAPTRIEPSPPPAAAPEPAPAPAAPEDPFAASGLFDGFSDAPLSSLSFQSDSTFQHNGQSLAPLTITTAQFGAKWGSCPHTSPISVTTSKIATLAAFMDLCKSVGLHNIESIPATNEGICGGMINATELVLIHGKVSNVGGAAKIDVTVKATNSSLSGCLAMYMQNLMR